MEHILQEKCPFNVSVNCWLKNCTGRLISVCKRIVQTRHRPILGTRTLQVQPRFFNNVQCSRVHRSARAAVTASLSRNCSTIFKTLIANTEPKTLSGIIVPGFSATQRNITPHRRGSSRHGLIRERSGGSARVGVDAPEVGGSGVYFPRAVPGCRGRAESGVGHRGWPVPPVPVGVLLEARCLRDLAVQQHAGDRWVRPATFATLQ